MPARPARTALVLAYGVTIRDKGHREHVSGQADLYDEPRARVVSWPPLRPTRLRRERGSVVVVSPTAPVEPQQRGAGDAGNQGLRGEPHTESFAISGLTASSYTEGATAAPACFCSDPIQSYGIRNAGPTYQVFRTDQLTKTDYGLARVSRLAVR